MRATRSTGLTVLLCLCAASVAQGAAVRVGELSAELPAGWTVLAASNLGDPGAVSLTYGGADAAGLTAMLGSGVLPCTSAEERRRALDATRRRLRNAHPARFEATAIEVAGCATEIVRHGVEGATVWTISPYNLRRVYCVRLRAKGAVATLPAAAQKLLAALRLAAPEDRGMPRAVSGTVDLRQRVIDDTKTWDSLQILEVATALRLLADERGLATAVYVMKPPLGAEAEATAARMRVSLSEWRVLPRYSGLFLVAGDQRAWLRDSDVDKLVAPAKVEGAWLTTRPPYTAAQVVAAIERLNADWEAPAPTVPPTPALPGLPSISRTPGSGDLLELKPSLSPVDAAPVFAGGAAAAAMAAMRAVQGPLSAEDEARFVARWAPYFQVSSPELDDYFTRLTPLLQEVASLRQAVALAAYETEAAVQEARLAALYSNEAATRTAASTAIGQRALLEAAQERLKVLARAIEALGPLPSPKQAAETVRRRALAHVTTVRENLPNIALSPERAVVAPNETVTFTPKLNQLPGKYTLGWSWGDGASGTGALAPAKHAYAKPGVYRVRAALLGPDAKPVAVASAKAVVSGEPFTPCWVLTNRKIALRPGRPAPCQQEGCTERFDRLAAEPSGLAEVALTARYRATCDGAVWDHLGTVSLTWAQPPSRIPATSQQARLAMPIGAAKRVGQYQEVSAREGALQRIIPHGAVLGRITARTARFEPGRANDTDVPAPVADLPIPENSHHEPMTSEATWLTPKRPDAAVGNDDAMVVAGNWSEEADAQRGYTMSPMRRQIALRVPPAGDEPRERTFWLEMSSTIEDSETVLVRYEVVYEYTYDPTGRTLTPFVCGPLDGSPATTPVEPAGGSGSAPSPPGLDPDEIEARAVRVAEIRAGMAYTERLLASLQSELDAERGDARRLELMQRLMQARTSRQADQDLVASLETGQTVHTRTPFDDYAHDLFLQNIRTDQLGLMQSQRQVAAAYRLAEQDPDEGDALRAFIHQQIVEQGAVRRGDWAAVRRVADFVAKRVKTKADMALARAQGDEARTDADQASYNQTLLIAGTTTIVTAGLAELPAICAAPSWLPRVGTMLYAGATGYADTGRPVDAVKQAVAWSSTVGMTAVAGLDGYEREGWTGAAKESGKALAVAWVLGKIVGGGESPEFMAARQRGIDRVKAFEQAQARVQAAGQSGATPERIQQLQRAANELAVDILCDPHAKTFLLKSGQAAPATRRAYEAYHRGIHADVEARFHDLMAVQGFARQRVAPISNAANSGRAGMDFDLRLLEQPNWVPGPDGNLVRNVWLRRNGREIGLHEWQTGARQAYEDAFAGATGRSAERAWENVTTSIHPESYKDVGDRFSDVAGGWLACLDDPRNVAALRSGWAQQAADVTRGKAWDMLHRPGLTPDERLAEVCRGTAKDIGTKLLNLLRAAPARSAQAAENLGRATEHWQRVQAIMQSFGNGQMGPCTARQQLTRLTGRESIIEIVEDMGTLLESLGKWAR